VLHDKIAVGFDSVGVGESFRTISTPFGVFACTTRAAYVSESAPDSVVAGPSRLKRVRVSVWNDHTPASVTLTSAVADI
jgi:hypothetical protein